VKSKSITIRFSDGLFFAAMDDDYSELEGSGETISDALRDLAEILETSTI
jgi:hypothetical protein